MGRRRLQLVTTMMQASEGSATYSHDPRAAAAVRGGETRLPNDVVRTDAARPDDGRFA
jgi:hypothetical protein